MDHRRRLFAQLLVRQADQRGVGHRRMVVEHVLDLGRIDVLTPADDHVFRPVDDIAEPLVVEPREVAGADPAVGEGRRSGFGSRLTQRAELNRQCLSYGWPNLSCFR